MKFAYLLHEVWLFLLSYQASQKRDLEINFRVCYVQTSTQPIKPSNLKAI